MAVSEREHSRESEASLIGCMARGDEAAAREVYETFCDPLLRFVVRRIRGSREDAEEITNDTFLAAMDMGETYDGSCSVFSWLCGLARNRIVDFHRRTGAAKRIPEDRLVRIDSETRSRLRELHDPSVSVEELVASLDRVRLVQALLNTLTPDQREAVSMRYVEGFSVPEIARIMRRTERSVERLLEKARERPRREMLRWLGDEPFRMICLELLVI